MDYQTYSVHMTVNIHYNTGFYSSQLERTLFSLRNETCYAQFL